MKKLLTILIPVLVILILLIIGGIRFIWKYSTSNTMSIPLKEYSQFEYPEDPSERSFNYGRYSGRNIKLIKLDKTHFDFILEPAHNHIAKIVFKNIDAGLFVTNLPEWTKKDKNLAIVALTDREWNRQQVSFKPDSKHLEVTGGNGFEKDNLFSAEIAKNCLNAGLWEILLYTKEEGRKVLYYQGWFTFPLGHYKDIFEEISGLSYWEDWHWWRMEHWADPAGSHMDLNILRKTLFAKEADAQFLAYERVFASGEQARKTRTTNFRNIVTWKDFYDGNYRIEFAAFVRPGIYDVERPWRNEYWRIAEFERAMVKNVQSPASEDILQEIEIFFKDSKTGEENRFIISGFKFDRLPRLKVIDYPQGLSMPMGIGIPPFFQSYEDLKDSPPNKSPFFCFLLNSKDDWVNHHEVAVDGSILHRDIDNPNLLHVYLLSYERHSLINHFLFKF